jgi:hypothetical protein
VIDFGGISMLIEFGVLSVLIISKRYQVDRNWSSISLINIQNLAVSINIQHIKLIEFGDIFPEINIQNLFT